MTIQACPINGVAGIDAKGSRLMASLHVALLAKPRHFIDEHLVIGGTMGIVAGKTVFLDR